MDTLPDEMLEIVFAYLPIPDRLRLERVSRKWSVVMSYEKMVHLDLVQTLFPGMENFMDTLSISAALRSLLRRCGDDIKTISFGKVYILITPICIELINRYCPNLENLDLSYCTVTENIVSALFPMAGRLITLDFANTNFSVRDEEHFRNRVTLLFTNMPKLVKLNLQRGSVHIMHAVRYLPDTITHLNLNQCSPLKPEALLQFLYTNTKLEELRLSAYNSLDDTILSAIADLNNLKILELSHFAFTQLNQTDDHLALLDFRQLSSLKELQELYLQYNNSIVDSELRAICRSCTKLNTFNLACNSSITDFAPLVMLQNLHTATIAATERFSDQHLAALALNGSLKVFSAFGVPNVGGLSLEILGKSPCGQNLTEISLSGHAWDSPSVTDEIFNNLLANCPNLEILVLQGCENLTDGSIGFGYCDLPLNLKTLDLSFCSLLTDDFLFVVSSVFDNQLCLRRYFPLTFYAHQTKITRLAISNVCACLKVIL